MRFRITGASMFPLLQPGDEVLVNVRAYRQRPPQIGDVVMVQHPREEVRMVKRVTAVLPNDTYYVEGDNPGQSSDSRTFGPLPRTCILGRVTSLFA